MSDLPRYAWIVTRDFIAEEFDEKTNVGVHGPSWAQEPEIEKARKEGQTFRLLDDDGNVYYHGKVWYSDDCNEDDGNPLEDFGMPNDGAVVMEYKTDNGWEQVIS